MRDDMDWGERQEDGWAKEMARSAELSAKNYELKMQLKERDNLLYMFYMIIASGISVDSKKINTALVAYEKLRGEEYFDAE